MTDRETTITVGRYQLHRKIARGGMATIHIAHLVGDVGFSRIVAAKRLLPELAQDREFVAMFLDEARVASKIHHRNVVPVLDVVTMGEEVILVQDFVHGVPLSWLQKTVFEAGLRVPVPIAVSIACQVLAGLHAAHETVDELGTPLCIVHRDVSPQNVMIATDGTARLLDFGVAKAAMASHVTRAGTFKGKIAYAAPEQIRGRATRQSDVYAVAVVLWELLAGRRLNPSSEGQTAQIAKVLRGILPRMTDVLAEERAWLGDDAWNQLAELQPVLDRGLALAPLERWATAIDMEAALAAAVTPAPGGEIATWVKSIGKTFLDAREKMIATEEASWRRLCAASVLRAATTAEQPKITAAEPPAPLVRPTLFQRPLALIAACALLGVLLAFGIAFLGRDVEPVPAPAIEPAAPPRDHTVARPMPAPPTVVSPIRPAQVDVIMPPARTTSPPPRGVTSPARRIPPPTGIAVVQVRPPSRAPARAAPPKKAPARVETPTATATRPSCSPPYYFEGDKKIFKASCL